MLGRVAALVAGLSFVASFARASTLFTWEFSGTLTSTSPYFADRYPAGTPFGLELRFDAAAPDLTERLFPSVPEGIYQAIIQATLQLGDYSAVTRSVYIV